MGQPVLSAFTSTLLVLLHMTPPTYIICKIVVTTTTTTTLVEVEPVGEYPPWAWQVRGVQWAWKRPELEV